MGVQRVSEQARVGLVYEKDLPVGRQRLCVPEAGRCEDRAPSAQPDASDVAIVQTFAQSFQDAAGFRKSRFPGESKLLNTAFVEIDVLRLRAFVLFDVRGFPQQLWMKGNPFVHGRIGGEEFGSDFSVSIDAFEKLQFR